MSSRRLQRQQKPKGAPSRTCPQRTWLRAQMLEALAFWKKKRARGELPINSMDASVLGWLQGVAMLNDEEIAAFYEDGGS